MKCASERSLIINYKHDTDIFLISKVIRLHYKTLRVLLLYTKDMADKLNVSKEVPFNVLFVPSFDQCTASIVETARKSIKKKRVYGKKRSYCI